MADTIATRVMRIISGSAHSLVGSVENMAPEMIMEEAVREVERAIDDVRAELGRTLSKAHMANVRLAEENRKHDETAEKIRLALVEKRDDLAEAATARLLDIEAQIPLLEATIAETREAQKQLEGYIAALQGRKREMTDDLAALRAQKSAIVTDPGNASASPADGIDGVVERAESAFNRAMDTAGGVAAARGLPSRQDAAKLAELDELARANRIKERLAAFRSGS